ncbi:oxygen-independent coproporphyrinogen III oxidase [Sphingomonas changnyeongensis]|uniref:Coproporphyrinogen-III oxidase n=1 Tax=Sphingomonas changnyeongensis TaxID=2698679 RepID=A0A7Z2NXI0_9SPHN|nr:oxygen-independent coproporphyrinogen III oxidase [Sphingomonas changnyeongensis]QHL91180.1 oxygen-independent coproporphyrinogen III oxidase [Sphingomonas changnyeongensis]
MWPYHSDLLARPVPRYTSYPTAAEFTEGVERSAHDAALAAIAPGAEVSLYLHIPYCHEICWYCGCNTGAANRSARLTAYLDALSAEIDLLARRVAARVRVGRIAFGGGSPNAISAEAMAGLVAQLRDRFDAPAPILSVELDPRSWSSEWEAMLATCGFQRASLGVQTFAAEVQARIGRVQPTELIAEVTAGLRRAGVASINHDLMYGLPGQDIAALEDSIHQSVALGADRLAVFGYAHVPHMLPRQRRIDASQLPDGYARFRQAAFAYHLLARHGYVPVGFDHFAKPTDPVGRAVKEDRIFRNFQGFTDDTSQYLLGLGASAISQFPHLIVQNDKSAGRYRMNVTAELLATERGVARDGEDQLRGRIIEHLLCRGHAKVPAGRFVDALDRLTPFADAGLVTLGNGEVRIAPSALAYARGIAACFDRHREPGQRQFSSAV